MKNKIKKKKLKNYNIIKTALSGPNLVYAVLFKSFIIKFPVKHK